MSTKKKLVISLTSLAIVLVVAIAAVGITLAALNGSVTSSFTITYTAHKNVRATVSASYKVGDSGEDIKFKQDPGDSEGPLIFAADQETASGTLKVNEPITLEFVAGKKYVVVSYTFKNDWTASDAGKTNLKITASPETITGSTDGLTISYDKDGSGDFGDTDLKDIAVIAPGAETTIKIKFELTEEDQGTKTVSLQVNLNWTLETQEIAV